MRQQTIFPFHGQTKNIGVGILRMSTCKMKFQDNHIWEPGAQYCSIMKLTESVNFRMKSQPCFACQYNTDIRSTQNFNTLIILHVIWLCNSLAQDIGN